jgi:molybdenum cofactor cytidylyltransferase
VTFAEVSLDDAEGAILAHSLRAGRTHLKKGKLLNAADLAALRAAGFTAVTAIRLDAGDLREDEAALRLAEAAAGKSIELGRASTGRANLFAAVRGLACFEAERVHKVNEVDEGVTIATVAPYSIAAPGDLIATVKIIPFAVPGRTIEECRKRAGPPEPLVSVAQFQPKRVGLVQTSLPGIKTSVIEKTVEVTRARLADLDATLTAELRCAHNEAAVAKALGSLAAAGCDIALVLGASAVADRRDVVPAAVVEAGGELIHFGMPVDPGNLTLLARLGAMHVLGLPGSARSPRLHGSDWVLARLCADLPVSGKDIAHMGVGGLLKEMPGRPSPRLGRRSRAARPARANYRVAALVLAAGQSRRMGAVNKLLAEVDGTPMLRRVVEAVLASRASPVIVITGHQADRVRAALDGCAVTFVHNPDFAEGISTSLRAGLQAVPAAADGILVCLGDMPRVSAAMIDRLIAAFDPAAGAGICVPVHDGKRGNPVLWARRYIPEMRDVEGDVGAKHLIGQHADDVREVEIESDSVLIDIDSPDALAAINAAGARSKR